MRISAAIAVLLALAGVPAQADDLRRQVNAYRAAHEAAIVGELDALTRLPSVAANPQGLAAAAATLRSLLDARGFKTQSWTVSSGVAPVVFGFYQSAGASRTVVFYSHYDGQPVTPSQWASDPFVPVMRNGTRDIDWKNSKPPFDPEWRLFGRAAADAKTGIVAFLAAFDALKASGRKPGVNIKVVWEGEEEANSPHLEEILKGHATDLGADLWLIGDGPNHQSRAPTLYFGARGSLGVEATIYGPLHALHDGHYGNWVPNPAAMAVQMIGEMRGADGHILIPGFSDDVQSPTAAERKAIAALPPVEDALKREFGIGGAESDEGLTLSTMRPALNIRGMRAGQVESEAANAIPVDARISLDFRLVPDQTPEHVRAKVEAFLRAKGWTVIYATPDLATRLAHPRVIKLTWGGGYPALRSSMTSPAALAVIRAANTVADQPVAVLPMMGGSAPLYLFHDLFKVPVIGLPVANHDDNQHGPDENIRLKNLWDGIGTYAAMMAKLNWRD